MCGRFLMDEDALDALKKQIPIPDFLEIPLGLVFPGKPALIIQKGPRGLEGDIRTFGLDRSGKRIFNARAETALEKPLFKYGMMRHRCLIPCARFYEWDPEKTMVTFWDKDPVMYLAGFVSGPDFVILTRPANESVVRWHARMPLVLPLSLGKEWVESPTVPAALLSHLPGPLENDGPLTLF